MSISWKRCDDGTIEISCGGETVVISPDGTVSVLSKTVSPPPLFGGGFGHRGYVRLQLPPLFGSGQQHAGLDTVANYHVLFKRPSDFLSDLRAELGRRACVPGSVNIVSVDMPCGSEADLGELLNAAEKVATEASVAIDLVLRDDELKA